MGYNEILGTLGISQITLENIIIFSVIAIMVGVIAVVYLQYIVAGIFALSVIYVFAHHESTIAKDIPLTIVSEPVASVQSPKMESERDKYMKDCVSLTSKESVCGELWDESQKP